MCHACRRLFQGHIIILRLLVRSALSAISGLFCCKQTVTVGYNCTKSHIRYLWNQLNGDCRLSENLPQCSALRLCSQHSAQQPVHLFDLPHVHRHVVYVEACTRSVLRQALSCGVRGTQYTFGTPAVTGGIQPPSPPCLADTLYAFTLSR